MYIIADAMGYDPIEFRMFNMADKRQTIKHDGFLGQSSGGGLVGALADERSDVLCAVPSSGATAVKMRAQEKGRSSDVTDTPFNELWDTIDHVSDNRPMKGFRLFAVSSMEDSNVSPT